MNNLSFLAGHSLLLADLGATVEKVYPWSLKLCTEVAPAGSSRYA